jgi:hypothetical protein
MDLMDIQDISYIDINELGVRPFNWIGGENEIEFDETTNGYFGKEKLTEFSIINHGKKLTADDDDVSMCDEDDENYDIDPETGNFDLRFYQRKKQHSIIFVYLLFCFTLLY